MSSAYQPDYPCLFPLGFHHLSISDIERVCVEFFLLSTTRGPIMEGLNKFIQRLNAENVLGDMWVNGSFLTEKIDPKDIDLVLRCDGALYNTGTPEHRAAIDWVIANQKSTLMCDSYVLFEYPVGHPLHAEGLWWYSWYHKWWGFSRDDDPKGIVVISLSGVAS
jgi:hypothetical protein